ncbi:Hypothetical protein CINCED_3A008209 [Cinara cedri]|uniref:COMM domain-containing protein 4 n=1 Tax=Cinara cedri TaxID=506608 RepID=A0A5E4ND38_9HEMI|nr:Hypothetical protein CINCED_3A008209 [Cinara cedri]
MKFKFCGGGDCPEWLLAEINSLSRMTSIKMHLLATECSICLIDQDATNLDKVKALMADVKLDVTNYKACAAAITFILKKAACHNVPRDHLNNELQQIGLPREHASVLCQVYSKNIDLISTELRNESLRIGQLNDVDISKDGDGEYLIKFKMVNTPKRFGKEKEDSFLLTKEQIQILIAEFSDAHKRMIELAQECKE